MLNTRIIDNGENIVAVTGQDVEPILEMAKAAHNEGRHGSADMRHVAEIPMVIVERYLSDKGITMREFTSNPEHIRALVNDKSLSAFRIWPGQV